MNLVSEIMNADSACCTPLTRIDEIERIMKEQKIKELPVVDSLLGKKFVGIITEDKIIEKAKEEGVSPANLNAEKCLIDNPIAIYAEVSIDECFHLMDSHHLDRIPVIDEGGRFCGVVEKKDVDKTSVNLMTEDEKMDEALEESFPASDPLGFRSKSKNDKGLHELGNPH